MNSVGSSVRRLAYFVAITGMTISSTTWAAAAAVIAPKPTVSKGASDKNGAVAKNGAALASHRATYEMSLSKISSSDGVRAASGTMTYTLTDRCDGYTIETNLSLNLAFANGTDNQVEQRYAAWEAKDGRSSTFRFQVVENGRVAKAYHGNIRFKEDGTGTATYEGGETSTFDLPRGTLLSTAHTLALLKSAAAKETFLSKMVIDGSFDEGPFWVTAAIAPQHAGGVSPVKGSPDNELGTGRYWPIGMAYFPVKSEQQTTPEYEITQNLLGTGVTHSMMQDFGSFTLAFKPVKMESIAAQACGAETDRQE
jgi:hypothetical protein